MRQVSHYWQRWRVCRLLQWSAAVFICRPLWGPAERNKSPRKASLQWSVSGVGLPCGNARLFRWKMAPRLVSPGRARGRTACRTAWFMRVVISAVAAWINHVAKIKLPLNDAQIFFFHRCVTPQSGKRSVEKNAVRWLFWSSCAAVGGAEPATSNLLQPVFTPSAS